MILKRKLYILNTKKCWQKIHEMTKTIQALLDNVLDNQQNLYMNVKAPKFN